MARQPRWAEALLSLRNLLVAPLGLKTSGATPNVPRDMIGIFPVVSATPDRLIAGFNDRHLDFRVVVDVTAPGDVRQVTATTLVKTHNWVGRTYLAKRFTHEQATSAIVVSYYFLYTTLEGLALSRRLPVALLLLLVPPRLATVHRAAGLLITLATLAVMATAAAPQITLTIVQRSQPSSSSSVSPCLSGTEPSLPFTRSPARWIASTAA